MGVTRYKVSYTCDCGCDYGNCGRKSFFLMEYNRSVDIGAVYHKHDPEDKKEKLSKVLCFTDRGIDALVKILTQKEPDEKWTDENIEEVKLACKIDSSSPIKEACISFRTWCDNKGYFCQLNRDHQLGYIRQENQIVFSKWVSPDELYDIYVKSKKS